MLLSSAWRRMIQEKNLKQKFLDTVPLAGEYHERFEWGITVRPSLESRVQITRGF
jgi:hypothetical protein